MIIIVFVLALFVFNEMKIAGKNEFFHDYISVKSTTAINGVFVLLVFLRHVIQYISLDGVFDQPFKTFNSALGQMIL